MEEKLYSNFIERIESDCFEVGNDDSINFTPEKASLYAGELMEMVYILGLFHTRYEKGFSSFLQCELIFPDLKGISDSRQTARNMNIYRSF